MSFYSLLIIGVFIFIIFLYLGSITNLFFSIISVIIGLTFIVGTSIIHSESIKENYLKHIDKILKS